MQPPNHFEQQAHFHAAKTSQILQSKDCLICNCEREYRPRKHQKVSLIRITTGTSLPYVVPLSMFQVLSMTTSDLSGEHIV
jgi:hypothetical protein